MRNTERSYEADICHAFHFPSDLWKKIEDLSLGRQKKSWRTETIGKSKMSPLKMKLLRRNMPPAIIRQSPGAKVCACFSSFLSTNLRAVVNWWNTKVRHFTACTDAGSSPGLLCVWRKELGQSIVTATPLHETRKQGVRLLQASKAFPLCLFFSIT